MIKLYLDYEKKMQRAGLFEIVSTVFSSQNAIYPGSYIHISPSLYFPSVDYIDMDRRTPNFFSHPSVRNYINQNNIYNHEAKYQFYHRDYTEQIPELINTKDLLISQYAGFVSQSCKTYLKKDGLLIANNSHGDAGVAFLDPEFDLIGVINFRNKKFKFSKSSLDDYFVPKNPDNVTIDYLKTLKRSISYKKTANHYLFNYK